MKKEDRHKSIDKILRILIEERTMTIKELQEKSGVPVADFRKLISSLCNDKLIRRCENSDYVELLSSGEMYAGRGYKAFLIDMKNTVLEPLKYYKTTRYVAIISLILSIIAIITSIYSLLYNIEIL
jgi:predicted transcriptional regulator